MSTGATTSTLSCAGCYLAHGQEHCGRAEKGYPKGLGSSKIQELVNQACEAERIYSLLHSFHTNNLLLEFSFYSAYNLSRN